MKRILAEVIPHETRMVLEEDGKALEIIYERDHEEHIVKRIYKGIVRNILPGIEAAFIDIGIGRNAYMKIERRNGEDKLYVGQSILVQVVKEEMDGKAARVTTDVSLAGRFMVLLPHDKDIRISKKITDSVVRERLLQMARPYSEKNVGFILRTAASKATDEELQADFDYLTNTFMHIQRRFTRAKGGTELYRDADFWLRIVRDYIDKNVDAVIVDDKASCKRLRDLLPPSTSVPKILYYEGAIPLFEKENVQKDIDLIGQSHVLLPSGGDLRIEHTEALTVIDVNSKSYIGKSSDVGTIALSVNEEAALEVCRQLRLRDIGGIIIVDFIDMPKEEQRERLIQLLKKETKKDRVRTVVCGMTSLGLVEMTRKRDRQGTEELLTDTCSACGGTGYLLSAETVYYQIVRKLIHLHRSRRIKGDVLVEVHKDVMAYFTKQEVLNLSTHLCRDIRVEESKERNRESFSILSL